MWRVWYALIAMASSLGSYAQQSCDYHFPVKVQDSILVLNDGTNRRFFLSGMVDNDPSSGMQLSKHDPTKMAQQLEDARAMGANAVRWNAFLKGLDFEWDSEGNIIGLCPDCLSNLKNGLDIAQEKGLLVQIVLSTAHFLKFGWGGENNIINGISNGNRVSNNYNMITTEKGRKGYIDYVIHPMCDTIGTHPALFGFVIINEAYGMTSAEDSPAGSWSDSTATLNDLRKFANQVSGALHRKLPGTICTVSGITNVINQYQSDSLIVHGGDPDGILDINQIQFYPNNHPTSNSPFSHSLEDLRMSWNFENKPTIAGEFPIEGISQTPKNTEAFTLQEAYQALWEGGYSGGLTWSNLIYDDAQGQEKTDIETAYSALYQNHLSSLDPWEFWHSHLCDQITSIVPTPDKEFEVFPNPTNDLIYFPKSVSYKIINQVGQLIRSDQGVAADLSSLPQGIYLIKTENASMQIQKN